MKTYTRRDFLRRSGLAAGAIVILPLPFSCSAAKKTSLELLEVFTPGAGEDIFGYISRVNGDFRHRFET